MNPTEILQARALPELLRFCGGEPVTAEAWPARRAELLDLLRRTVYGYSPDAPESVRAEMVERDDKAFAGKAVQETVRITFDTPSGPFSFPFTLAVPKTGRPVPAFLLINFFATLPNRYCPAEELIDNGYAIAQLYYQDVTLDDARGSCGSVDVSRCFDDGLAACYPRDPHTGWGKIGIWAWAASRVMDVLQSRPELDLSRIAVVGHSRLGKTALWCAAQDLRFSMAVSNDSGCGGASLFRGKKGENIAFMRIRFPYWFCGNYSDYGDREAELPADQHFLLALLAPRGLLVNSSALDAWADPDSEFLAVCAAAPAFELLGASAPVIPPELPGETIALLDGDLAYARRAGTHYFSRTDWLNILHYRRLHQI